jgi:hypothetical protein
MIKNNNYTNMTRRLLFSMLTLLCCAGVWAEGELNGWFTINASGGKVQFSQGNLQYFCSTSAPEWRFAEHQYDYVDFDISAYAANSGKWIDLFAHGTSGYDNGQTNYQPYVVGAGAGTYYQGNLTGNTDWGYNAISNGGNTENSGWRTLTKDEWNYLFDSRSNAASKYGHGSINGVNGMILLPDSWTLPDGLSFTPGNSQFANSYTLEQWALMEAAGAVFLPASGSCNSTGIPSESTQNQNGFYRASTAAYYIHFRDRILENCANSYYQYGDAVRLVKDYSLNQDGEGNYLLGSAYDWKLFATLVQTMPTANAKMTADIDLGTDVTMVGTESISYQGSFDGQGHTLTVNYNSTIHGIAPFQHVGAATISNLHVDGSIVTTGCGAGGIVSKISGNLTVSGCWVSATLQTNSSGGERGTIGGIGSYCQEANCSIVIEDCIFTGVIVNTEMCGGFMSHLYNNSTSVTMRRCLNVGTNTGANSYNYTFIRNTGYGTLNLENSTLFYKTAFGNAQGTQATTEQLADGTTTTALNAGRTGDAAPWGQYGDSPRLKIFCADELTAKAGDVAGEYWTTYYNNKANMKANAGTIVYKVALGGTTVTPTAIADGIITKGQAVVLKSTSADVSLSYSDAASEDNYSGNALLGSESTVSQDGSSSYYVLSKKTAGIGFYKLASGISIPAHKAYFKVTAGSRDFYGIDDEGTTAIKNMKVSIEDNVYYDLQGRRILYPTKGLYIVNGKKVIIK